MNRAVATVLSVTAAVVLLAGAGAWWFLRDDAPEEVDLSAATAGVAQQDSDGSVDGAADGGTFDGDVSGTWSVDTDTGDFDYESATGTFAGFRIAEELAGIGSTTAVGRTGDVSGTMEIDGETVTAASFEVDLTTITTDDSRRDDKVQDALDTSSFPTASFTLTEPIELGSAASTGEPVSVSAIGDLTINGVTKAVTVPFELTGSAQDPFGNVRIGFEGGTAISRKDWGVTWNAALETGGVLVSDKVKLEFDVSAIRNA